MRLRTMILIPLFLAGIALSPTVQPADAASMPRAPILSVTGSGGGAVFNVYALIYWDFANLTQAGWQYEVSFYGMDGGTARRVAAWTFNVSPGTSLIQTIRVAASNSRRWANEDRDRVFPRGDEITCRIRLYRYGVLQTQTDLSNQVTGNF